METELNPYAAPKAEAPTEAAHTGPPRRPRSVKWATFVLGLLTAALIVLYWRAVSAVGAEAVWQSQRYMDPSSLVPAGFFLCLFRRHGRISFCIVAFTLGWATWRVVSQMWPKWTTPHAFGVPVVGERVGESLFTFGLVYLFYRFVFGLPSRAYHGMARQKADGQEPQMG